MEFTKKLAEGKDFQGKGSVKQTDFSARDRITRAPKALGFDELTIFGMQLTHYIKHMRK